MVMHGDDSGPLRGIKPHLAVKLKAGWDFHPSTGRVTSEDGRVLRPEADLPPGSRIVPTAPELAGRRRSSLTADEANLARHLQVILPEGTDPSEILPRVEEWDWVDEARLPPEISLPGTPG